MVSRGTLAVALSLALGLGACASDPPPVVGGSGNLDSSPDSGASDDQADQEGEESGSDDGDFECIPWGDPKHELGIGDPGVPSFVDVTEELGLNFAYYSGEWPELCPLEGNGAVQAPCTQFLQGASAAVADVDEDGDFDIYLTRLQGRDALYLMEDGVYVDVAEQAGIGSFRGSAATFLDWDRDGDLDIYVSAFTGRNFIYLRDDDALHFTEHAEAADMNDGEPHYGYATALGDYNRDGIVDIYTSDWRLQSSLLPEEQYAHLFRGLDTNTPPFFENVTVEHDVDAITSNPPGVRVFSPTFVDLDENGWQDLALVADVNTTHLFFNEDGQTFTEFARLAGANLENNAMGSTFGDVDGDGHLDWYTTAIFNVGTDACEGGQCDSGNRMYRNEGYRCFEDIAYETETYNGYWGWGAALFDFDNDGDQDLVETNGFRVPFGPPELFFDDRPMRAWQNDGLDENDIPIMTDVTGPTGFFQNRFQGRGLIPFDYDGDGDLDVLVTDNGPNLRMYRNDRAEDFCSLTVRLVGETSHPRGLGAKLRLRRFEGDAWQVREMGAWVHFNADLPKLTHFGLGPGYEPGAETVDELVVEWPASGKVNHVYDIEGCSEITVYEADGE